jgi:CSLREA domain-containing protein
MNATPSWSRMSLLPSALVLGICALLVLLAPLAPQTQPPLTAGVDEGPPWAERAIMFEPNLGQAPSDARFLARALGGMLWFTAGEVVLSLPTGVVAAPIASPSWRSMFRPAPASAPPAVVRLQFVNANRAPHLAGVDQQAATVHYLRGTGPGALRFDVPTYGGMTYQRLYPGVDLRYDSVAGGVKGTYTLAPGADPGRIRWRYAGAAAVTLNADGALQIALGEQHGHTLIEQAPLAWQEANGGRTIVPVRYTLAGDGTLGFVLGAYDRARPLVIDPTLEYGSYLGGGGEDFGFAVAVDPAGNTYVTGLTRSLDFPTRDPFQPAFGGGDLDVFVTKFDREGRLVYSTYLGGSRDENGFFSHGIAVDPLGNAYIGGTTQSRDFPTTSGALLRSFAGGFGDAFVTKLDPSGRLVYSTFLGGSENDVGLAIAVDPEGSAFVAGATASPDFPHTWAGHTTDFFSDVFVAKLDPRGATLRYGALFGGALDDQGVAVAVGPGGDAYVAGSTSSADFPTVNAFQPAVGDDSNAFVARLNAQGNGFVYSTYLGGSGGEGATGIAVDNSGNVYVIGATGSADFPVAIALQPVFGGLSDAFVSSLDADGARLRFSTYLGGSDSETGFDIDVAGDTVAVTGATTSEDFPTLAALQPAYNGGMCFDFRCADGFVTQFTTGGTLRASTYYGGIGDEVPRGIALGADASVSITGFTSSFDLPIANAVQPTRRGATDAFVARIGPTAGTVTTTDDELNGDGDCSLRESIRAATLDIAVDACPAGTGADTIFLPSGVYRLSLTGRGEDVGASGDLDLAGQITIVGVAFNRPVIDGAGLDRVFDIQPDAVVALRFITVQGGDPGAAEDGGGIRNRGALTLEGSLIAQNTAEARGGGIFNAAGRVMVENSTIAANQAGTGGGIANAAVLRAANVTVSGNQANGSGGGFASLRGGDALLNNVTVTANSASAGGGFANRGVAGNLLRLRNTILAGNSAGQAPDCDGRLYSQGYSLFGDRSGCTLLGFTKGNTRGEPRLGPLQNNGGSTPTHALLSDSPALDAGNWSRPGSGGYACATHDQRGVERPQDGDTRLPNRCDIGAVERIPGSVP